MDYISVLSFTPNSKLRYGFEMFCHVRRQNILDDLRAHQRTILQREHFQDLICLQQLQASGRVVSFQDTSIIVEQSQWMLRCYTEAVVATNMFNIVTKSS